MAKTFHELYSSQSPRYNMILRGTNFFHRKMHVLSVSTGGYRKFFCNDTESINVDRTQQHDEKTIEAKQNISKHEMHAGYVQMHHRNRRKHTLSSLISSLKSDGSHSKPE